MLEFLALVEDMVKTRNAQIVTILGSIGLMFGVSAMCGVSASEENPSRPFHLAQYMAPPQPMGQSLGTVRQGDINNQQQNPTPYANPSMPPISSMSATPLFDSATVLQPVQIGDVSYLTGGIGDEERYAMKQVENDYNLRIMSASKSGDFVGDTRIVITRNGQLVLDAQSGPLFFVNLPAGPYVVEATSDGQNRKQNVTVGKSKSSHIRLTWQ